MKGGEGGEGRRQGQGRGGEGARQGKGPLSKLSPVQLTLLACIAENIWSRAISLVHLSGGGAPRLHLRGFVDRRGSRVVVESCVEPCGHVRELHSAPRTARRQAQDTVQRGLLTGIHSFIAASATIE